MEVDLVKKISKNNKRDVCRYKKEAARFDPKNFARREVDICSYIEQCYDSRTTVHADLFMFSYCIF